MIVFSDRVVRNMYRANFDGVGVVVFGGVDGRDWRALYRYHRGSFVSLCEVDAVPYYI